MRRPQLAIKTSFCMVPREAVKAIRYWPVQHPAASTARSERWKLLRGPGRARLASNGGQRSRAEEPVLKRTLRDAAREDWPYCLLAAAVLAHLGMMGSLFWGYLDTWFDNSHSLQQGIDFFSVYEAGHNALENRSVYYFDAADTSITPHHNPFRYLPSVAYVLAVPMNALSAWPAYWGWVSLNELLLVVNAYLTWQVAGRGKWGLIAASMWFAFTPFYVEQYVGQFSFLMATFTLLLGIGLVRGRQLSGGVPWAISIITKSNSALLLPVLVRFGWWKPIAIAGALLALNIPYYLARWRDFEYFLWINVGQGFDLGFLDYELRLGEMRFFVDVDHRLFTFSSGELGLTALLRNSFLAIDSAATSLPGGVSPALIGIIVAVGLAATFMSKRPDKLALFGLWILTFFLVYGAWEHHYVMLLPVLALLVALRPASRPLALVVFTMIALPSPYWLINAVSDATLPAGGLLSIQESWPVWGVIVHHMAKPLPVVALWAHLVYTQVWSDKGLKMDSRL